MVGMGAPVPLLSAIGIAGILVLQVSDPSEWMRTIGGPVYGVIALLFVLLADLDPTHSLVPTHHRFRLQDVGHILTGDAASFPHATSIVFRMPGTCAWKAPPVEPKMENLSSQPCGWLVFPL
jgi:hypothetical protein